MLLKLLDKKLPIWVTADLTGEERIDNNFFHVSYYKLLIILNNSDFQLRKLSQLIDDIKTGNTRAGEEIPVLEGLNISPNVIYPLFEKFTGREDAIIVSYRDLLVVKDGSPAVVAPVTRAFLEEYKESAVGTHVYLVSLRENFKLFAAYVSCWLNSICGQAILRRYIAGSVSPTLRQDDLLEVLIPIPKDENTAKELAELCENWLEDLQNNMLERLNFANLSEEVLRSIGDFPKLPRLPTNWYSGIGRDPHGFHRRSNFERTNTLEPSLPIWISEDGGPDERLDNNYWHPAYKIVENWLNQLDLPIKTIGELKRRIFVGETPSEDGEIPVIEGRNMKPNCIFPEFQKYTDNFEIALEDYDLLIVRHGTSGLTAIVLPCIRHDFEKLAVSDQIHVVRVKERYKEFTPYICIFLNSAIGQALLRRYIGGSISPTLNRRDLVKIPIPLPTNEELVKLCEEKLTELQESFLQTSKFVEPSWKLIKKLGLDLDLPKLPINWMPGGKRDPQRYC